jgi:hypothetical protein
MSKKEKSVTRSITIFPDVMFTADYDSQELRVDFDASTILRIKHSAGEATEERGKMHGSSSVPMGTFPDEETAQKWAAHVYKSFYETFPEWMTLLASDHLELVCGYLLNQYGFEKIDVKQFIDERAKFRARELKRLLHLSVVGNFSAWTRTELARAVRSAIVKLKKESSKVTQDAVADKLKETHGEIAPKNGEALGALLKRNTLDWMKIKNRQ